MPKPPLKPEYRKLEGDLIDTMIAGLHEWRSDLNYPESHSDMQACVRGVLKMFDVERLPLGLTNNDIVEPTPICSLDGCNRKSYYYFGPVPFCGTDHAREFGKTMLDRHPTKDAK